MFVEVSRRARVVLLALVVGLGGSATLEARPPSENLKIWLDAGAGVIEQAGSVAVCEDQAPDPPFNDAIFHLKFLFLGESEETVNSCKDACDSDDSGDDDFTDDIKSLRVLFLGQGAIPGPGLRPDESHPCGVDPTPDDEATCVSYDAACPQSHEGLRPAASTGVNP